ncbi:MAG: sodium:solute symporter [Planctomycetota bacterium]|nr:sodium:solute symporter [Planctomycetota bacterium]
MDIQYNLHPLDLAVIAVYVTALIGIGMWVSFRRRGAEDLFLAGNSLRWPSIGLSIFGTNINPVFLIASCGIAYTTGMVTANFEWLAWWFLMLLAMLFVPHYLATKVSTMPQFMQRRFGETSYRILTGYSLFSTVVLWLGGSLYAGGLLLEQMFGWPLWVSVSLLTVIATSFTVAGGLAAVVITDAFQSILMIAGATLLTIIGIQHVGGIAAVIEQVPAGHWHLFRPADDPEFPWIAIVLGYPVMGVWFWCTDQTIVQRVLGAKDLRHGQGGALFAGFLKILTPFIFMMPGILCMLLHPDLENPDAAFMTMVTEYMPMGMAGLIFAVLIAALISTLDSGLNSFSTIFTLDIYARFFRPAASPMETKMVGRVVTVLAGLLAIGIAVAMKEFGRDLFTLGQSLISFFAPPMAAVFLIGVLWKRATSIAASSTLLLGSTLCIVIGFCHLKGWPSDKFWPHYLLMSFYLFVVNCTLMVVVSLMTRKSPYEEDLPSLGQARAWAGSQSPWIWGLWGLLAAIMLTLYVVFN